MVIRQRLVDLHIDRKALISFGDGRPVAAVLPAKDDQILAFAVCMVGNSKNLVRKRGFIAHDKQYRRLVRDPGRHQQLDPLDEEIWLDYSEMFAELKEFEHAYEIIETGLKHLAANKTLQYRKVAYLFMQGKRKEALKEINKITVDGAEGIDSLFDYSPGLFNDPDVIEIKNRLQI